MSYCRWNSMNWMCDVYCYEDVHGGWTTHVAGRRREREPQPGTDDISITKDFDRWWAAYKATMDDLETIPLVDIGLPHDGETFNDDTLEDFRDRLTMLRTAGYNVPDFVFDVIAEEMAEDQS